MIFEQIDKILDYLNSQKKIDPSCVERVRLELEIARDKYTREEFKNAKVYYTAQLASGSSLPNMLTLIAILVALLTSILLEFAKSNVGLLVIFAAVFFFALLFQLGLVVRMNTRIAKKSLALTIVLNLIDELI